MNSVGANIKARRRELGMNQDELARRLGLTQANISRIEANAKGPSADMLPAIAEALCCDVRDLLGVGARGHAGGRRARRKRQDLRPEGYGGRSSVGDVSAQLHQGLFLLHGQIGRAHV